MENILPIHHQRKQRDVTRMNGNPMLRGYDLSQHGFFVLSHAIDIARILGIELTMDEMDVILRHDFAETVTSDLPFPIKNLNEETQRAWDCIEKAAMASKDNPAFDRYSDDAIAKVLNDGTKYWILKFSDMLELAITLWEERSLGNRSLQINRVICKCAEELNRRLEQIGKDQGVDVRVEIEKYLNSSKFPNILCPTPISHASLEGQRV